jgi:hypothetical protein
VLEVQNFTQQNTTKCVYIQQRPTATGLGGSRLEGVRLWTSMPSMPSVYATTVCQGVDHSKLWVLISRVFSATAHSRRTKLQKVFGMKPKDWHKHFTTAFNPGRRHYMKVRKLTTKDKKMGAHWEVVHSQPAAPPVEEQRFFVEKQACDLHGYLCFFCGHSVGDRVFVVPNVFLTLRAGCHFLTT